MDVRTFCGSECGFDHFLVIERLKVKLKKIEKRREEKIEHYDIQKLEDLKTCEDFRKNIINEIKKEHLDYGNHDIKSIWSAIRNVISKTAKKKKSGYDDLRGTLGLIK
jgi:hypothetical protein